MRNDETRHPENGKKQSKKKSRENNNFEQIIFIPQYEQLS